MAFPSSIIFDLDGTLLDTLQDIAETANDVLRHRGYPEHSLARYSAFVGDGLRALIGRILPAHHDPELSEECCRHFLEYYEQRWYQHCRPYRGIVAMLASLERAGIPMAVLSNKPHAFTVRFIERFFAESTFSLVFGQRQGVARKPDPTAALEIAERLRTDPREMLMVGDTAIDIRTGKAAAMKTVAVTWGFRTAPELIREQPDLLINHPSELEKYVFASS